MTSSLSPPAPTRSRASSTTLRPALTLHSLGRRRSSSLLTEPASVEIEKERPSDSPSMIVLVASRFLQWFHWLPKHEIWPPSSSTTKGDHVLPMSASAHQTTFADVQEKVPLRAATQYPSVHTPILIVISLFPLSTGLVFLALTSLPVTVSWPRTLSDLAQLGTDLHGYSQSGALPLAHVLAVMSLTAVWKHAWSIPGSVIWNVLAGALFSPALATILLTFLTMIGSVFATMLSKPLAPFLMRLFPKALDMTRAALEGNSLSFSPPPPPPSDASDSSLSIPGTPSKAKYGFNDPSKPKSPAWIRLSVLRLIGVVPWSGINIACGVCGVNLLDCMLGGFIGTMPWTAVTCQIGDILQTVASAPSSSGQTLSSIIFTPAIVMKLIFLSFLSLAPILGRGRLQKMLAKSASEMDTEERESVSRWERIAQWREQVRERLGVSSSENQARSDRERRERELAILVQEKRAMSLDLLPS